MLSHLIEARTELRNFGRTIDVFVMENTSTHYSMAGPLVMSEMHEAQGLVEFPPTFSLGMKAAQQLMDDLWRCGLRPTEGSGSAGSLAATERHLADLQKIVFAEKPAPLFSDSIKDMMRTPK